MAALDNEDDNDNSEDVKLLGKLDGNHYESTDGNNESSDEDSDDDEDDNDVNVNINEKYETGEDKNNSANVKRTLKKELAWYVRLYLAQLLHDGHCVS